MEDQLSELVSFLADPKPEVTQVCSQSMYSHATCVGAPVGSGAYGWLNRQSRDTALVRKERDN